MRRHLTQPAKLSLLMAILAIAVALAAKSGAAALRGKPIATKTHGRKAASLFAHGLAVIRKALANPDIAKIRRFLRHAMTPLHTPQTSKQCEV